MGRKSKRPARVVASLVIGALLPTMGFAAVKEEVIDRYWVTTTRVRQPAVVGRLQVLVYRWTTPQEREEIVETLVGPANETSFDVLDHLDIVGRIGSTELIYVWRAEQDGKLYVVGVSRPRGAGATRSARWSGRPATSEPESISFYTPYVTLFQLELDEAGTGTGILAPAAYPKFESNGTVGTETGTADLILLTAATRR